MTRRHRARPKGQRESAPSATGRRPGRLARRPILSRSYYEPIRVDASSAARGVRWRLFGALVALSLTTLCILTGFLATPAGLAVAVLLSIGLGALSAAVALLLSARREEIVHQLASDLNRPALPHDPEQLALQAEAQFFGAPMPQSGERGVDGSI